MYSRQSSKLDKAMTTEQFNQVVDAILEGKYSWACVLILRFAGYNPLHYIPYRTYNRLMKENCYVEKQKCEKSYTQPCVQVVSNRTVSEHIKDLNHLEEVKDKTQEVKGGERVELFNRIYDFMLFK
jgi:hypothetical protein